MRDILEAISEIQQFVDGIAFEEFSANREKLKAILANFTIIGEAARGIPEAVRRRHPAVAWKEMQRMRNIIVHVYFAVNAKIVWDTLKNDLPLLQEQLRAVLNEEQPLVEEDPRNN